MITIKSLAIGTRIYTIRDLPRMRGFGLSVDTEEENRNEERKEKDKPNGCTKQAKAKFSRRIGKGSHSGPQWPTHRLIERRMCASWKRNQRNQSLLVLR